MKLQIDVQASTVDGLNSEIKHLTLELKETRDLQKVYEEKCDTLIKQLTEVNSELNSNKRLMIGYSATSDEKEQKISLLKEELGTIKIRAEELHLSLGTL